MLIAIVVLSVFLLTVLLAVVAHRSPVTAADERMTAVDAQLSAGRVQEGKMAA